MIKEQGVSPGSPAHQVLLAPDVGGAGVQDPPLPPLHTWTTLHTSPQNLQVEDFKLK